MKKHTYRTKNVKDINWLQLKEKFAKEAVVVFAIDIAKEKQFALLTNTTQTESVLLKWDHPKQTADLIIHLKNLTVPITVVLESTGTYGDALRFQFRQAGFEIYQACAKRVHDAKEIYDGVPSLHDAKSAFLIAKLHLAGLTKPWRELNQQERKINALQRQYELHQSQYERNQNRLEAYLSRHWPEVLKLLDLNSVTLERLLIEYGSPEYIAINTKQVAKKMAIWGHGGLKTEKITTVIDSAKATLGQPCVKAECLYLQALAVELSHSRLQKNQVKKNLEAVVKADDELCGMVETIGAVTTAVLLGLHLDPRNYESANSFRKALGLNLKEKSSGQAQGKLMISKRGSAMARKYLYYAALRLIQHDAVIGKWYQLKIDPQAKNKTVIALMRKLALAVWYLARGATFDANKLVTIA